MASLHRYSHGTCYNACIIELDAEQSFHIIKFPFNVFWTRESVPLESGVKPRENCLEINTFCSSWKSQIKYSTHGNSSLRIFHYQGTWSRVSLSEYSSVNQWCDDKISWVFTFWFFRFGRLLVHLDPIKHSQDPGIIPPRSAFASIGACYYSMSDPIGITALWSRIDWAITDALNQWPVNVPCMTQKTDIKAQSPAQTRKPAKGLLQGV